MNLRKATRTVTQIYNEIMHPTGLRGTQFTFLVVLFGMGPATLSQLAQIMVTDRTTLTRNLKPLQKQGLVKIESGDDRRTRIISLTDKGQKTLEKALPLWEKAQDHVIKELGQQTWSNLIDNLQAVTSLAK